MLRFRDARRGRRDHGHVRGLPSTVTLSVPDWFDEFTSDVPDSVPALDDRMTIVNELARRNVDATTGGPFAAGVFERDSGRIVSLGVNRVVPLGVSSAHAEITALSLAQVAVRSWDLGAEGLPAHQLVVNWRTCAMCFGAVLWSGVVDLVLAGVGPEMEELTGFDEGPIHPDWEAELRNRGVNVTMGVGRAQAIATFEAYRASGAPVYNGRGSRPVTDAPPSDR
jgi:tRNA(Arg) A34 adenosine deaminase TadA